MDVFLDWDKEDRNPKYLGQTARGFRDGETPFYHAQQSRRGRLSRGLAGDLLHRPLARALLWVMAGTTNLPPNP